MKKNQKIKAKNASTHIPKDFGIGLARFFADPTRIVNGIISLIFFLQKLR
jgi:hypothetical protein